VLFIDNRALLQILNLVSIEMRKLIEFLVSYTKIEFAYVFRGKNRIRELVSKDGNKMNENNLATLCA
jgi:hypothetical protein